MFRSISENPHMPAGKRTSEVSKQMKATQYELGRQEWHEKWQSQTKDGFAKVTPNSILTRLASGPSQVLKGLEDRGISDLLWL
jgi:hypothetical protein